MADEAQGKEENQGKIDILLEGVPGYLYDQIKIAAEQTGTTLLEWIMGACHMRYSSQFRDNLLASAKRRIGGGGGSETPVI